MDIGVADESLNGIPYEESSESEEEEEAEETEGEDRHLIRIEISTYFYVSPLLSMFPRKLFLFVLDGTLDGLKATGYHISFFRILVINHFSTDSFFNLCYIFLVE